MSHLHETLYKMNFYDQAGVRQFEITDMASFEYMKQLNDVGYLRLDLPAGHRLINFLDNDWQVKVQYKLTEHSDEWLTDWEGLFRSQRRWTDYRGVINYTSWFVTGHDWLTRSIVAYRAGTANRNEFSSVAPETIAKNIVKYNATSLGTTADGRLRNVDGWQSYITVETDNGVGDAVDYHCAWKTTLEAVQGIAQIADADFDMVKTGPTTWQFRWYPSKIGTDVTSEVIFSLNRHNMENPSLEKFESIPTVAIVAGEGEEADRRTSIQTHGDWETNHNSREIYIDARNFQTTAGLAVVGANRLRQLHKEAIKMEFKTLQVANAVYREHYTLGDIVGSEFQGISQTHRVIKATVTVGVQDAGGNRPENVDIFLAEPS